jgi:superfamily II DNA or RNA helicase
MEVADWIKAKIVGEPEKDRNAWQWKCIFDWYTYGFKATIEACTGSGKSWIGYNAIEVLRREDKTRKVIVVVPSKLLKAQWEDNLKKRKMADNTEVYIINSLIKGQHECDLVIFDEIHRMVANTFIASFDLIEYKFVLGLTATVRRLDGRHEAMREFSPVCHILSLAQAKQRGWIENYREYWLGLELNESDRLYYDELQISFRKFFKYFDMDFNVLQRASGSEPLRRQIAGRSGVDAEFIQLAVFNSFRYIRLTRKWLMDHESKIDAAYRVIQSLNRKTLAFGESIAAANALSDMLGSDAMAYHSEMEPIIKETFKDKEYKTEINARRAVARAVERGDEHAIYKLKHGSHIMQTRVMKKITGKKLKEYVLHKIANTQQLRAVISAKALNEGFDYPGAELGVVPSRSRSSTTYVQQTGRVVRLSGNDRLPVMVHIYLKDTKDQGALFSAGFQAVGAIRVDSVDELVEHLNGREVA